MQLSNDSAQSAEVKTYLVQVNNQLFAVLFWYVFLGPLAALAYRLISLAREQARVVELATKFNNLLDWVPARMTSLLYLLVGNFQMGILKYNQLLITTPDNNEVLLGDCGIQALGADEDKPVAMMQAETLVEHALVALLVFIALFTLIKM